MTSDCLPHQVRRVHSGLRGSAGGARVGNARLPQPPPAGSHRRLHV